MDPTPRQQPPRPPMEKPGLTIPGRRLLAFMLLGVVSWIPIMWAVKHFF